MTTLNEMATGKTLEQIEELVADGAFGSHYPIMEHRDGQLICVGTVDANYPSEFNGGQWHIVDDIYAMADTTETTVCGMTIQHDASGQGHAWRAITRDDIPASIVEEIEGEIIDGKRDECEDFVASNGQHYRW